MFAVRLIGVLALVALNGFFAAAEFSLVAVRLSRIRQLVAKGDVRARVVERLLADLHRVVSGVQVGITLTSLAIGALGEATLAAALQQIWHGAAGTRTAFFAHAIALGCAFALLSAMHVVLGELVPKTVSFSSRCRFSGTCTPFAGRLTCWMACLAVS
jgi:putative hemolysin